MDGVYFNNFILVENSNSKVEKQKKEIEELLDKNKEYFFVNTTGFITLLKDLSEELKNK